MTLRRTTRRPCPSTTTSWPPCLPADACAQGWGSAVECAETNCGTVPAHTWTDTKIIMDVADPNYKNTLYKGQGVTGDMSTSDGGKIWTVSAITIPEFTF
ncbi:hypothetical protein F5B21DRAFT_489449 [Xylaria acuta]|nr:hypothetical protein F5B21DRAFT_489449 [Xylaria acuta]